MTKTLGFLLVGGLALAGCAAHSTHHPEPAAAVKPPPAKSAPAPAATAKAAQAEAAATEAKVRPFPDDSLYDLLVAEFALRSGDYRLALDNYVRQAHATLDTGVIARATRLAEFLSANRTALSTAQLWVSQDPDDTEAQFTLATELARAQRPLAAVAPMTKVLDAGAKPNFAVIAAAAAAKPKAVRTQLLDRFNALLATHKDNVELMTGKALLLQELGQKKEALALARKVLDIAPDETYAIIIETKLLEEMGRSKEAFARLKQMVAQNPYNRRLRLQYARLLTQTDMKKARQQFAILVAQSPGDPDLLLSLALVTKATGALDDAEHYFRGLLAMHQHVAQAHFYLGQIAEERGHNQAAIKQYEAIEPGPEFYPALGRTIALQLAAHKPTAARKHLRELRALYPKQAVRLYLIEAGVLMQLKEYRAGTQLITAALKKYPGQPNLLYSRSNFSERRHDIPLLEKDLRAILRKDPNNAIALNALGYALADQTKRYHEAHALIRKALAQKPDDPAIMDSMGWVEYRLGNLQSAHQWLEKAYAAYPDPEVAAHLSEVLWHLGDEKRALKLLHKAMHEAPDDDTVRAVSKRIGPAAGKAGKPAAPK